MIRTEYNGFITPFVPTGKDLQCGTADDPFMMRMGRHLQIDDPAFPTHIVGEEYSRLKSKSPDRLYQTYASYEFDTPIRIRDDDTGDPILFTLPGRCNEEFFCFQGKQCKGSTATWGTYSHTQMTCIPQ